MPKRTMTGVVVSDKMDKTVVVKVEKIKIHPKFKKHYRVHKKYKAHDEKNQCKEGDLVVIEESRPLSKEKRWRVVQILRERETSKEIKIEDKSLKEDKEDKKRGVKEEMKES
ncbi:30S ribosomal protein S17 [bacterium]|nr:30S ribosomal protein S17 [bacterium]